MKKFYFLISFLLLTAVFTAPLSVSAAENAGIKPGSFFYGFVTTFEKVNLFFTFNPEKKAEKALKYAEKRLTEAEAVARDKNSDAVKTAISGYEASIALAAEASKKVKDETKAENLLNLIADNASKHQEILSDVLSKVPNEAKEAITKAIEVSRKGQEEALQKITELKQEVAGLKQEVAELKKPQGASSATPPQNTNAENQSTSIKELKQEVTKLNNRLTACRRADRLWAEIKSIPSLYSRAFLGPEEALSFLEQELVKSKSYISDPYQEGNGWNPPKNTSTENFKNYKESFDKKLPSLLQLREGQAVDWQNRLSQLVKLKEQYDKVKPVCDEL